MTWSGQKNYQQLYNLFARAKQTERVTSPVKEGKGERKGEVCRVIEREAERKVYLFCLSDLLAEDVLKEIGKVENSGCQILGDLSVASPSLCFEDFLWTFKSGQTLKR